MQTIVEIEASHVPEVVALWEEAGLAHPWNDSERDIRLALSHPTNVIFGAREDDGTLVGTIMTGFDGHRGWIYSLAVADSQRGKGTGKRLVQSAETWLAGQGAPVVRLLVQGSNAKAAGFYEACGYERGDFIAFGKKLDSGA
ncbi:GNAT family acetyltransferase [Luteibacter sp.]|jgi:ribosomal protein S18 acetylase RimI-like enzyme|uniref:GNAT family acetyltransferase n=1 Tax=Luteibacter sp. TaxID=1886636 RepID=UPI002F41026C